MPSPTHGGLPLYRRPSWHLMGGQSPGGLAPSGYVAEVNDECSGCGACAENTCHFEAISMNNESTKAVISLERCMGCGVCEDVCPVGAISLRQEPSKGEPLDIDELKRQGSPLRVIIRNS